MRWNNMGRLFTRSAPAICLVLEPQWGLGAGSRDRDFPLHSFSYSLNSSYYVGLSFFFHKNKLFCTHIILSSNLGSVVYWIKHLSLWAFCLFLFLNAEDWTRALDSGSHYIAQDSLKLMTFLPLPLSTRIIGVFATMLAELLKNRSCSPQGWGESWEFRYSNRQAFLSIKFIP